MKFLGTLLILYGLASTIYSLIDKEVRFLMWINNWGPEVAWAIRIGFMVVGLVLWLVGGRAAAKREA